MIKKIRDFFRSEKEITQHEAAFILAKKTNNISRGWLFELADNRRAKALKDVGTIPFEKKGIYVFYRKGDIEAVAYALKCAEDAKTKPVKLFP
ncbi:hypothetical protein [Alteromonas flava]|uniref:hypothetical protein n=1 Tax=Alteromonas flava TaxID=2048003 RepID=UPI000C28DB6D|nr:hypothetical protein [Alteromonas flava]